MSSSETRISSSIDQVAGEVRLGRLRRVNARELWPGAGDLTPLLRSNPELLGEALRLEIRPGEGQELAEAVGELTPGVPVLVKARFEDLSDGDLRDLAAHVADLDAGVLVLLSPSIPDDARERLTKLNRNTTRAIVFYGVEFDLWQIDDSAPAPLLRVVAGPEGWDRAPQHPREGSSSELAAALSEGASTASGATSPGAQA
jgi:hypothetical protein